MTAGTWCWKLGGPIAVLGFLAAALAGPATAAPGSAVAESPCLDAIRQAERSASLPDGLLGAIGVVETGRVNPRTGRPEPWPWAVDVEGRGALFDSKDAAVAAVQAAWKTGARSIDVGCMQINLQQHPAAFGSLDDAFDPSLNTAYAAGFLLRLHAQTRDWGAAAAAYHSQTPELGAAYRQRVAAWWPGAGPVPPASPRTAGVRPVDPLGIYTPEFRARLAQDAADRARRIALVAGPPAPARRLGRSYAANLP